MTIEQTVGATVGALSFVGASAIQATTGDAGNTVTVSAVSAIIGAAVSYGILRGTVRALERNREDDRREFVAFRTETHNELRAIRDTTQHTATQVARIEGTMERRGQPRG